jgi:hypothetical protein
MYEVAYYNAGVVVVVNLEFFALAPGSDLCTFRAALSSRHKEWGYLISI